METTTKLASEIRVGDKVVERDGCYFEVAAVAPSASGKTISFTLSNINNYMSANKTLAAKCRATARVSVLA